MLGKRSSGRADRRAGLAARRRAVRLWVTALGGTFLVVVCGGIVYGLYEPAVRVAEIRVSGPHAESFEALARETFAGTYAFLAPRDSIFFLPESAVRQTIEEAYPDIAAVSVSLTGFDSISISAISRTAAFLWCGFEFSEPPSDCYEADDEGFVYAPFTASSSPLLRVYTPLEGVTATSSPIRSRAGSASVIPETLRLIRALRELGAPISSLRLRDDEADLFVDTSGTRITYVIGREEAAAALAAAAFPGLVRDLDSIDYIDLRFDDKAYVKRKGE